MNPAHAPEAMDFMVDAKGRHVPVQLVKPIDQARDHLVRELVVDARKMHTELRKYKTRLLSELEAFLQLSAEQYGVSLGGAKGNLTLHSYDGKLRIQRQVADRIMFDERLQVAKELIDQCVRDWSSTSDAKVQALVEHAFQTDREGKISTERVLGLRKVAIDDPQWLRAMDAITDSITVASTAVYVRFHERDDAGHWVPLSLDLAGVPTWKHLAEEAKELTAEELLEETRWPPRKAAP